MGGPIAADIFMAKVLVGEPLSSLVPRVATASAVAPPNEVPSSLPFGVAAAAELLRAPSPSWVPIDLVVEFSRSH